MHTDRVALAIDFVHWNVAVEATGARDLIVGDVDGDGDDDLISRTCCLDRVVWYENLRGSPHLFEEHILPWHLSDIRDVSGADLDGDKDLDLLAISLGSNTIYWFENDGRTPPNFVQHVLADFLDAPVGLAVADINGDDRVDVISGGAPGAGLLWFENTGEAPPGFIQHFVAGPSIPFEIHAQDLDNDDDADIVVGSTSGPAIVFYENDGASLPNLIGHVIQDESVGPASIHAADINNDGAMDILSSTSANGTLSWFESNGTKPLEFEEHVLSRFVEGARGVLGTDLDQDGDVDVIAGALVNGQVGWLESDGKDSPEFVQHVLTADGLTAFDVSVSDVDGDGDIDVVAAGNEVISVYISGADPIVEFAEHRLPAVVEEALWTSIGDLDRDGDADMLSAAFSSGEVYWHENVGGRPPAFSTHLIAEGLTRARTALGVDLDGDHDLDVLMTEPLRWLENRGGQPLQFVDHFISDFAPGSVSVADINGDGRPDIVAENGYISWFENDGASPTAFVRHDMEAIGLWVDTDDVDSDGDVDIVSTDFFGPIWYENDGTGEPSFVLHLPWPYDDFVDFVSSGDADGDGDIDILTANDFFRRTKLYENVGGSPPEFLERNLPTTGIGNLSACFHDVDGDGHMDIVHTDGLAWLQSNGAPRPAFSERYVNDEAFALGLDAGDIDGDGDRDISIALPLTDQIAWYENLGVTVVSAVSLLTHNQGGGAGDGDGEGDDGDGGGAEYGVDLLAMHGVEPRAGGAQKIALRFTADLDPVSLVPDAVLIRCNGAGDGLTIPQVAGVTPTAADEIVIELTQAVADGQACTLYFGGVRSTERIAVTSPVCVRSLFGDVSGDGGVTGGDFAVIKPVVGRTLADPPFGDFPVEPRFDLDRNGVITGADMALVKPQFGKQAADCPD